MDRVAPFFWLTVYNSYTGSSAPITLLRAECQCQLSQQCCNQYAPHCESPAKCHPGLHANNLFALLPPPLSRINSGHVITQTTTRWTTRDLETQPGVHTCVSQLHGQQCRMHRYIPTIDRCIAWISLIHNAYGAVLLNGQSLHEPSITRRLHGDACMALSCCGSWGSQQIIFFIVHRWLRCLSQPICSRVHHSRVCHAGWNGRTSFHVAAANSFTVATDYQSQSTTAPSDNLDSNDWKITTLIMNSDEMQAWVCLGASD